MTNEACENCISFIIHDNSMILLFLESYKSYVNNTTHQCRFLDNGMLVEKELSGSSHAKEVHNNCRVLSLFFRFPTRESSF